MGKSYRFIKEVIVLAVTVALLIFFNCYLAVRHEDFINQNGVAFIDWGLEFIGAIEFLRVAYYFIRNATFKMARARWKSTLNDLRVGVKQNLRDSNSILSSDVSADLLISQCLGLTMAYTEGCNHNDLLEELRLCFENEKCPVLDKEEIAYVILSNKGNKSVAEFCSTPQGHEFFLACESMSQNLIRRSTFVCEKVAFDSEEFRSITNEFFHIGLAYGTINTDERVDYIRKVLSWVRQEIKRKSSVDSMNFQRFVLALSKIENNLIYHNLDDELIETYIKQIKRSWYFRRMYWNANMRLWFKKYHTALTDRVCDVDFVITYSKKFGIFYRFALHSAIRRRMREYKSVYHENFRDAVPILILAVPLGNMGTPDNNYVDMLSTVLNFVWREI